MNLGAFFKAPVTDYIATLDQVVGRPRDLLVILVWAMVCWWVYVPVHELLHAYGCLWSGGQVSRLEISPWYGAALLSRWFPFVVSGSDYAGQLTGFDTRGNDWIYFITVFAPYVLTLFIGVPLLLWSQRIRDRARARLAFGLAIPMAFAPFISIMGDYYEMAAILVSRVAALGLPGLAVERWRSDDLILLSEQLFFSAQAYSGLDVALVLTATMLSLVGAFATYALGRLLFVAITSRSTGKTPA